MPPTPIPPPPTAGDFRRALEGLPDDAPAFLAIRGDAAYGHPALELRRVAAEAGRLAVGLDFFGVQDDEDDDDDLGVLSQMGLVGSIFGYLAKCGVGGVEQRQMDAVIRGANLIMAELGRPAVRATPGMGLAAWSKCDDTGASSLAMAGHLEGLFFGGGLSPQLFTGRYNHREHPIDPADLGRCLGLLDAEPGLRGHLLAMAELSPEWARLVAAWPELERLYREELPTGNAPRCHDAMRAALEGPAPDPTPAVA